MWKQEVRNVSLIYEVNMIRSVDGNNLMTAIEYLIKFVKDDSLVDMQEKVRHFRVSMFQCLCVEISPGAPLIINRNIIKI